MPGFISRARLRLWISPGRVRLWLEARLPTGPAVAQLRVSLGGLLVVVGAGVAGYVWIADFSAFDALYQTVLTVTTIGFQEVNPMGRDGRIFTIFLSIIGVGAVLFVFGSAAALIFEGDLKRDLRAWKMSKRIEAMRDHVVVCGAGRVGHEVASELAEQQSPFVIIDSDHGVLEGCHAAGWAAVAGDASDNQILRQAGIEHAKGLIVATQSDAENTFIVLTARGINPDVYVVARISDPQSDTKLYQAGANRVISPTAIAGRRMAIATLHPSVIDFAETVLRDGGNAPLLAQLDLAAGAPWDGVTIEDAFRGREVRVLGVRSRDGVLDVAPGGALLLTAGDALMVYGMSEAIQELAVWASARGNE
jgi:voltage-gated potassium channel